MCVLLCIKHVEQIFGRLPLSSRAEKESGMKKKEKAIIYVQNADMLERVNYNKKCKR